MARVALSVVSPRMGSLGWPFSTADEFPGATPDPVNNAQHVKDLYLKVDADYGGRRVATTYALFTFRNI